MPRIPEDAVLVLGVTKEDIFFGPMAFVFGVSSTHDRVGVYSFARLYAVSAHDSTPASETMVLRRACKVLTHESGHMFSMLHCLYYDCNMNGSNHLAEMDGHPLDLCPLDLQKMERGLGLDIPLRYRRLRDFFRAHGMEEEAQWSEKRLAQIGSP